MIIKEKILASNDNASTKQFATSSKTLFLVFTSIFVSLDTLLFGTTGQSTMRAIGNYAGAIIVVLGLFLHYPKPIVIKKNCLHVYLILIFCMIVSALVNNENIGDYIVKILIITASLLIVSELSFIDYLKAYLRVVYFLSVVSILMYFISIFFPNVVRLFPTVINSAGYKYKTIGAWSTYAPDIGNIQLSRNLSIFREPGVYAVFLCIALVFCLFSEKLRNTKYEMIFLLAIITTMSTTGYIIASVLLIIYLFALIKSRKRKVWRWIFIVLLIGIVAFTIYGNIFTNQNEVFYKIARRGYSLNARIASFGTNLQQYLVNPITGVGQQGLSKSFNLLVGGKYGIRASHNTNTILMCFAAYGTAFGVTCCFCLYQCIRKVCDFKITLFVFLAVFLLLSAEMMWQNVMFYSLLFYGVKANEDE